MKRLNIPTTTWAAALLIWTVVMCIMPNICLSFTEQMSVMERITNVVLPLGLYIFLMSLTNKVGKATMWMFFAMFFGAFQIVLLYLFGRSPIAVDMFLNVVTSNAGEIAELLGNLIPIIMVIVVMYITALVGGYIAIKHKWRLPDRFKRVANRVGLVVLAIGLVCMAVCFAAPKGYALKKKLFPANVIYNVYLAVDRSIKLVHYHETSKDFTYGAVSTHDPEEREVYVVVLGETSRACNWHLFGYNRETTPHLSADSSIVAFPRAVSQSNTTHKSVPMLLSPLHAANFNDSIYSVKSLITAFKEAGYHTAFYSNQRRNHSFIDFFGAEADTCVFIRDNHKEFNAPSYDTDLLACLDTELARPDKKILVVLHGYGSHFAYADRYKAEDTFFKPDGPMKVTAGCVESLVNGYDNTIRYADKFLAAVTDRLRADGGISGMIYASDHGEDIFDDNRHLFLHASPVPSYYQIHVPFLTWTSEALDEYRPELMDNAVANSDKFVASSRSLFNTILDMAGIATPLLDKTESVVSSAYTPKPPMYLNDHNEGISLWEIGLLEEDFRKFSQIGLEPEL